MSTEPLDRKKLIHALAERLNARKATPEVITMFELIDAMIEDGKEMLVTAQPGEYQLRQGMVQGLRRLHDIMANPSTKK